jgi:hypothetical protein
MRLARFTALATFALSVLAVRSSPFHSGSEGSGPLIRVPAPRPNMRVIIALRAGRGAEAAR